MSQQASRAVCAWVVAGLWAPITVFATDYRFVRVADTRDGPYALDPGRHASINNVGTVAFWRQQTFGGGPTGIFEGNGGVPAPIATSLDAALTGMGVLEASINDSGQIAFYADGIASPRIFMADPGGTITLVASTGAGTFGGIQTRPSINNFGAVAFRSGSRAYLNSGAGNIEIYGPTVPATGVAVTSDPFLNNAGQVSIAGSYGLAVGGLAHLRGSGGPPTIIADGSSTVTSYGNSSVNDAGVVVFGATTTSGQVIFTGFGGGLTNVADSLGPYDVVALDANSGFGAGGDPAINAGGVVAFVAKLDTGPYGIFTGADPDASRVIQNGSVIFGRSVVNLFGGLGRNAISDSGEIAFQAQLLDAFGFSEVVVKAVPFTAMKWADDSDGVWSDSGNWIGPVPNTYVHDANFTDAITAPRTVTVDGSFTVGSVNFDNASSYTVAGGGTITLDDSFAGQIAVVSGQHAMSAALQTPRATTINVAAGSKLTLSALQPTVSSLTKTGTGTLEVNNLRVGTVNLSTGTTRVLVNGSVAGTSKVGDLTIAGATDAWTARLDLSDNDLIVDYTGATVLATVKNKIKNGYAAGAWTGNGITTSLGDSSHGLGFADNASAGLASFSGQPVDSTSVLVKFTYFGDANLDGQVDITDLAALATNWQTAKDWSGGDFDYSGFVDITDLARLATNWQAGVGAPLSMRFDEALASVGLAGVFVPEPLSPALAVLSAAVSFRFRRRAR